MAQDALRFLAAAPAAERVAELEDLIEEIQLAQVCGDCQRLALPLGNHRCA